MDSIAISSSGGVSVRALISHIMPQLHPSSVLRGVHRATKDSSGHELTTSLINGRLTKTATVDMCCDILDKMSGDEWDEWRASSGPAFKRALRERVASVLSSDQDQVEQAYPPAQQVGEQQVQDQGVEKKAVVLRKALRAINIDGSVRVDEPTGMVSDIDVIRMLCPESSPEYAAQMLKRVLVMESANGGNNNGVQNADVVAPLTDRVRYIKINGHGNVTPCSDAPTAIEIIWLLPGSAFKRALRERVASVLSSDQDQVEQAHPPAQQVGEQQVQDQGVEKKAVVLRKALRAVNIDGSVRVDEPTGMVSDIDVIRMLCPEKNDDYAKIALKRILEREQQEADQNDTDRATLADRVRYIKINGGGHVTPCSDAPTVIEIIWLLPGSAARAFRKQSAETIARVLGGDVSLSAEIEQRCARLQSTDEGTAFQSVMLGQAPAKKHKGLPEWFEYATNEQKRVYVAAEVKKSVVFTEIEMHEVCKDKIESVGQFGGRDGIEFADRIRDTQRRAAGAPALASASASAPDIGDSAIVVATAIDNSIDPASGKVIATHKVSASVRGPETSICTEAAKIGISTGEKSGQIGKVAKRLYGERYGQEANRNIPTRHTTFRGKPFVERTYFSRDADLIQQAIRMVCCPDEVSTS